MWAKLSPLLAGQAGKRGVTAAATRGFVEGGPAAGRAAHGDAACASEALRALIAAAGAKAVIQPNLRRKNRPLFDPLTHKDRHHIEQTCGKFKQSSCIATRCDKLDRLFDAFLCLRVIAPYLY